MTYGSMYYIKNIKENNMLTTCFELCRININSDDAGSSCLLTAHDSREADGTKTKHCTVGARFHFRSVQCCTISRRYAAAEQADFIQPRFAIHLPQNSIHVTTTWWLVNQATRYASQHIWYLSQARINWEGCVRKAILRKNGGDSRGGGTN